MKPDPRIGSCPLRLSALQAVDADGRGALQQAKELYFRLLECLTRCHALEAAPACQAAIMARFKVKSWDGVMHAQFG